MVHFGYRFRAPRQNPMPNADEPSASTPPSPLQTAYEEFNRKTPFVTRTIVQVQVVSYACSWLVDPHFALANIPMFTIGRFEVYRIFTSPLVNTRLFNLIFAALGFVQQGKCLEESLGSSAFGYVCVFVCVASNLLFILVSYAGSTMTSSEASPGLLLSAAEGMWQILFGVIAMEAVKAPRTPRPLFFCKVPSIYYPVALFGVFAFVGQGLSVASLFSLGLGYLWGFGKLDELLKPSATRISQLEETGFLANFVRKPGWVKGESILGSGAWNRGEEDFGMSLPLRRPMGAAEPGSNSKAAQDSQVAPIMGGGRTLGSSASRRSVDPRAARLQALERQPRNLDVA